MIRTKLDSSNDPLGLGVPSATETRATARPVATCAPATEPEPELKSLDVGKLRARNAAAAAAAALPAVARSAVRPGDQTSLATQTMRRFAEESKAAELSFSSTSSPGADDPFGAAAVSPLATSHRRPFVASSSAAARLREDEAVFDDLLVGKILEREEFSADDLFGSSVVRTRAAHQPPPPPPLEPALDLDEDLFAAVDRATAALDVSDRLAVRAAATDDGPFSSAVVPPPAAVVTDDFDFESYIAKEAGSGGGLFD